MPLVATSNLPTFSRLRATGQEVLDQDRAVHQDIRELHIGFLNMMPDAALEATERQFLRLLGASNRIAQFHVHPFTIDGINRLGKAAEHVANYYEDFNRLQDEGLDALIITGANPAQPELSDEGFWPGLLEVFEWAAENVCSTLCSCLATHAFAQQYHDTKRVKLPQKRWGVYSHRVTNSRHPLVSNVNTRFDAPQSHFYEVSRQQLDDANLLVLADSPEACVHLATSADGLRFIFFQGHPEYDMNSLLKEYKREVSRYMLGERDDYPPFPENYISADAAVILQEYKAYVLDHRHIESIAKFPESRVIPALDNTWTDTSKAMFNNWLGLVYQLTSQDRRIPLMKDVDPNNPLGIIGNANGDKKADAA